MMTGVEPPEIVIENWCPAPFQVQPDVRSFGACVSKEPSLELALRKAEYVEVSIVMVFLMVGLSWFMMEHGF